MVGVDRSGATPRRDLLRVAQSEDGRLPGAGRPGKEDGPRHRLSQGRGERELGVSPLLVRLLGLRGGFEG
ncbi:hypothetical protein GCM10009554_23680 [Kribbella koreensis]|uniref:Uncharacterized protein n=1 Tax=Kribbella koreensis TaxID=57909 RepID=A0ABN1Q1V2_9ACTN